MRLRCAAVVAVVLGSSALGTSALAQQAALPLNRFNPSWAGDRYFGTASASVAGHMALHGMLVGEYSHDPLVFRNPEGEYVASVVEHQLFAHANATFALYNSWGFNVDLPLAIFQSGDDPAGFVSPSGAEVGDLRFGMRARLAGEPEGFFQLGIGGYFWAPTGSSSAGSYVGNGAIRGKPYVSAGGHALRFIWGLEAGIDFRESQDILGVGQGTMLCLNLANGVLLGPKRRVQLTVELIGAIDVTDVDTNTTNFEALGGAKWRFLDQLIVGGALGPGIFPGIGTPDFRAVGSFAYSPSQE